MEARLMEKVGTQRTLSNVNVELSLSVPIWVTCTMSPLGNLTEICTKKVIEERRWIEWTIWSVAPLSRIQSMEVMKVVLTCEEKTEYSKELIDSLERFC